MLTTFKEGINIIRKITPQKIWNIILLRTSYYFSLTFKRVVHWGNPFALSIEPTTSCNLRCPECPSGLRSFTRPTGMLDFDFYKHIIDQFAPFLSYLMLYFQGEPYLNPYFFKLVEYACDRNIYTSTSTNAHFLDDENARLTIESGLDRIVISLDGTDQEAYGKYRIGGKYEKVLAGIQKLLYWKKQLNRKNPLIILQFLILRSNQHQINEVKKLSKKLKVDQLVLKTAQVYDLSRISDFIPDNPDYTRYNKVDGEYKLKNKLQNKCWRMWSSSVITWDGKVVPCCFDKDAEFKLGDITKHRFYEIWNNEHQLDLRKRILKSRKNIKICKNCTNGSDIWAN